MSIRKKLLVLAAGAIGRWLWQRVRSKLGRSLGKAGSKSRYRR